MNVNWKIRFKHKPFLIALFSILILLIQQVAGVFGFDTTIYNEQATEIFNTVLVLLSILGVISDPTTEGVSDSPNALRYEKPKKI